jgi:hypothetical protein
LQSLFRERASERSAADMFKSRWRGGRAKAVFKLQFHATQARLSRSVAPEAELRVFYFAVD